MSATIISKRYQILQSLGEGGFGQTFLAVDLQLPTKPQCVVKKLQPQATDEENVKLASRLFEQEADVLYRLGNHPNIPNLLAHFEDAGEFYLVQELIAGETLAQEFERGKKYSEAESVDLLEQILDTLTFVHQQNVIHRDIKPSNLIRRNSDGKIFLIDFGAVKQVSINPFKNAASFHSTVAIGSAGYIPSEQAAGKPCFSSDLYGVGLVAIQALTLLHPLKLSQNRNTGEFVWQHKTAIREDLVNYIAKLVRYDYRQRWYSAKESLSALQMVRASLGYKKRAENTPQPRVVQQILQPQFLRPSNQPMLAQPILSFDKNAPSVATAPKFNAHSPIPPTVVYLTETDIPNKKEGVLSWIRNNDIAKVIFIALAVLGVFTIIGFMLIVSLISAAKAKSQQVAIENNQPFDSTSASSQNGAFAEAIKQGNEADELAKRATTKAQWQEVAGKYQRASTLMASVDEKNDFSPIAKIKLDEYQINANEALKKANGIQKNPFVTTVSTTQPTSQPISTPYSNKYPIQPTSTPNTPPVKHAKMPGKRKEKMYISFSSSSGDSIGGGQDRVFTNADGNFSAKIYSSNTGQVTLRFDGGPDWWSLDLAAPQNQKLVSGRYTGAQRCAFHSPTRPGLDFSGSGRGCNRLVGNFNLNNIIYSEDGVNILLLDVTFVQSCEESSPPLMGRVYYDAR